MTDLIEVSRAYTCVNLGVRPAKPGIRAIILHDTAGNGGHGDTKYLAQDPEKRGIGVDFTVERDGTVYQLNPVLSEFYTSHAGRNTALVVGSVGYKNKSVNLVTVGIEICQKADLSLIPMWPSQQVTAAAALCVDLCRRFGLTKADITTHRNIITDGSRSDPRKFPFTQFWETYNELALSVSGQGIASDKRPPLPSHPLKHTVVEGDTLYSLSRRYKTPVEHIKALNNRNEASNVINVGEELIVRS